MRRPGLEPGSCVWETQRITPTPTTLTTQVFNKYCYKYAIEEEEKYN
jgi:hypothetical protein